MKKKHNKTKRYIVIEFDGTTTRACTFRAPWLSVVVNDVKGLYESQAKLHPDDVYDQNENINISYLCLHHRNMAGLCEMGKDA